MEIKVPYAGVFSLSRKRVNSDESGRVRSRSRGHSAVPAVEASGYAPPQRRVVRRHSPHDRRTTSPQRSTRRTAATINSARRNAPTTALSVVSEKSPGSSTGAALAASVDAAMGSAGIAARRAGRNRTRVIYRSPLVVPSPVTRRYTRTCSQYSIAEMSRQ